MISYTKIKSFSSKKRALLIIFAAVSLFLLFMSIKENIRHHQLASSMDALHTDLKSSGLPAEKSSGCGSGQGVYGPTGRSCSISITVAAEADNPETAQANTEKFEALIQESTNFTTNRPLEVKVIRKDNPSVLWGSGTYKQKRSGSRCGLRLDYTDGKDMRIVMSCDDSSWFTRTFQFN